MEDNKSVIDGMTPDMQKVYNDFHANPNLVKEWQLCTLQYNQALATLQSNVPFASRMEYKKICDYWNARRTALEKVVSIDVLNSQKA